MNHSSSSYCQSMSEELLNREVQIILLRQVSQTKLKDQPLVSPLRLLSQKSGPRGFKWNPVCVTKPTLLHRISTLDRTSLAIVLISKETKITGLNPTNQMYTYIIVKLSARPVDWANVPWLWPAGARQQTENCEIALYISFSLLHCIGGGREILFDNQRLCGSHLVFETYSQDLI